MTVHVHTAMLLEQLGENRQAHLDKYNKNVASWSKDLKKAMDVALDEAQEKDETFNPGKVLADNPYPVLRVDRYDDAITRLEWEARNVLELDDATFNAWVKNKWPAGGYLKLADGAVTSGRINWGTTTNIAMDRGGLVYGSAVNTISTNPIHSHTIR